MTDAYGESGKSYDWYILWISVFPAGMTVLSSFVFFLSYWYAGTQNAGTMSAVNNKEFGYVTVKSGFLIYSI